MRSTLLLLTCLTTQAFAFTSCSAARGHASSLLHANALDYALLQDRVQEMKHQYVERDAKLPPNENLEADQFCKLLLEALQSPDDPWPDAGFRVLIRSSTKKWKAALYRAIGAPTDTSPDKVAAAMSSAVQEEGNKFQLLVKDDVSIDIATEPLDFMDGTCWVKCRLLRKDATAVLGMSLVRENGAWMLDEMNWRDGDRYHVD